MTLPISINKDEDGVFIAEYLFIPGCVSQGPTEIEALANLRDAIRECLEVIKEFKGFGFYGNER